VPARQKDFVIAAFLSLLVLSALAADADVTVRPLVGDSVKGKLAELSAEKVTLQTSDGPQRLETSKLMWIELPAAGNVPKPTIWIDLLDGSRVHASGYTAANGKARITLPTRQIIEVPTRSVRTVRFNQQTPELATQWREITSSMASGDVVVIRKTSTRTVEQGENEPRIVTEQALDQVEGTLLDVSDDTVLFEAEGQKVPVRREKLEGLVYYQPAKREFSQPLARLIDAAGSTWLLRDVALSGEQVKATNLGNVPLVLPLAAVAKIDFSVGNVAFLTDLEADTAGGEQSPALQPAGMSYKFSSVLGARPRPPLGADSFRIAGQRYENGLSLHSPNRVVFRVPAGFRFFYAVVGVDDSILAPGRFNLVVMGDNKELARHPFTPEQKRQPISLTLDVSNVRRLAIALEPADGQDIGDQLDFCEARFTK
jgi:hypothetical protein